MGSKEGWAHLCHGAGIRPSKGVCSRPISLEHRPQGMEQRGRPAVRRGLTRHPSECRNPQSLSKPMGWTLGSPRWKGEGRGVVVKCHFTKIAQMSAAEGWRSAGGQPPSAGGAMPWVCVIPRACCPPPIT